MSLSVGKYALVVGESRVALTKYILYVGMSIDFSALRQRPKEQNRRGPCWLLTQEMSDPSEASCPGMER